MNLTQNMKDGTGNFKFSKWSITKSKTWNLPHFSHILTVI